VVLFEFMDNTTLLALPEAKEAWWWDFANGRPYDVCDVICTERESWSLDRGSVCTIRSFVLQ
jgi:hypothetical protein